MVCPKVKYGIAGQNVEFVAYSLSHSFEIFRPSIDPNTIKYFITNVVLDREFHSIDCVDETIRDEFGDIANNVIHSYVRVNNKIQSYWIAKNNLSYENLENLSVITKIGLVCPYTDIAPIYSSFFQIDEQIYTYIPAQFEDETGNLTINQDILQVYGIKPFLFSQISIFDIDTIQRLSNLFKLSNFTEDIRITDWHKLRVTFTSILQNPNKNFLKSETLYYTKEKNTIHRVISEPSFDNTDYTDLDQILANL